MSFNGDLGTLRSYNEQIVRVSTANRSNLADLDTNCTINFQNVAATGLSKIIQINLDSICVCNNFRNVPSYANSFILQWFDGTLHEEPIYITPGYYDATQLAALMQTAIQVYIPTATVIYDTTVYRFKFATNSATGMSLQVNTNQTRFFENSFLYNIGANPIGTALELEFTLTNRPALFGATQIYILSDRLAYSKCTYTRVVSEALPRYVASSNINQIFSMGIDVEWGTYQVYYDQGSARGEIVYPSPIQLDTFDFKVVDNVGNILEPESNNTPITINFKIKYL